MMFGGGGLVVCNGGLFRCRGEGKKKEIEEERVICLSQGKKFKSSQVNAKSLFFF